MRKIKYLLSFIIIGLLIVALTGCSKSIEKKKEISIKDIINDKKEHMLYVSTSNDDEGLETSGLYLTKNGQMKMIMFDEDPELSPEFLYKLDADEIKQNLKDKGIEYSETPYKDVKSYIEVTTNNGDPVTTFVTTKDIDKKEIKKDFLNIFDSLDDGKNSALFYTDVNIGQSQSPKQDVDYLGQFTFDPSSMIKSESSYSDNDTYFSATIKLDNKDQKLIQLPTKDKDVTQIKFSDLNVE
ncbi:hypothetical protein BUY46_03445 [Staphylococcus devriesei]|nr:hypothetical protein BUY46_03445 [Staphylococcus devriesei]